MDQWEKSPVGTTLGTVAGQLAERTDALFILPLTGPVKKERAKTCWN